MNEDAGTEQLDNQQVWQKIVESAEKLPCLKMTHYLTRITDIHSIAVDLLQLYSQGFEKLAASHTARLRHLIDANPQIWQTDNPAIQNEAKIRVENFVKTQLSNYPQWIINQGLVSFCTFLDGFFEDVVDIIYIEKPELLLATKTARKFDLADAIKEKNDQVIDVARSAEVHNFSFLKGIKKRVQYLDASLAISVDAIFDWSSFTGGEAFSDWDIDKLAELFSQRHGIVHHDLLVLESLEELSLISDFFGKIILNVSAEARSKHGVLLDMNRQILQADLYQKHLQAQEASKA